MVPAALSVFQTLLVLFVFRFDTPKYYKQNNNKDAVRKVEGLIYAERDTDINVSVLENFNKDQKNEKVPLLAHFSPKYRAAFMIGCILAIFQQMTGINAVIFYSNTIFTKDKTGYDNEKFAKIGTMLVGVTNWGATLLAIPLLTKFGRKTLLIFGQIGMGISLLILGILAIKDAGPAIIVFTLIFVAFFEFGIGPILWLYAAEIMTETGMASASLITWIITIIFGLFTEDLFKKLTSQGMYFTFTAIDILGLLFIIFIIKETKGLSKDKLEVLYSPTHHHELRDNDEDEHLQTNDN